jgi:hypothetical protein
MPQELLSNHLDGTWKVGGERPQLLWKALLQRHNYRPPSKNGKEKTQSLAAMQTCLQHRSPGRIVPLLRSPSDREGCLPSASGRKDSAPGMSHTLLENHFSPSRLPQDRAGGGEPFYLATFYRASAPMCRFHTYSTAKKRILSPDVDLHAKCYDRNYMLMFRLVFNSCPACGRTGRSYGKH